MKKLFSLMLLSLLFYTNSASAEEADDQYIYTMTDENGAYIMSRLGRMYTGDEYISGDNMLYEVIFVDDESRTAIARSNGPEAEDAQSAFSALSEDNDSKLLVCMYSTHSDESYIPGDGESSKLEDAGIYDVGRALKKNLEENGIQAEYSEETFHPHDAGAYRRSRSTAAEFVKKAPDALIDIHRDGIPAEEYETTVQGEETSMVRLFVGKSNANAGKNRAFAKKLKAVADQEYPGLIKDIYIGKGNYNQDLYPEAILLEFGTHEIDKQRAISSTEYMANVIKTTLTDNSGAKKSESKEEKSASAAGIGWLIALSAAAAIAFALFSTGSLRGAGKKLKRGISEITGGAISKKKK